VDKVRITWILAPTKTFLDDSHILSKEVLDKLLLKKDILFTQTPYWVIKIFYLFDESNIPSQLSSLINPKRLWYWLDNKEYLPAYVWYTEAQMMIEEKLFSAVNDKLEWFFWNDVLIAWLPKKTETTLDMFHFVPKKFRDNYLNSMKK
jgi:hypothetical protein